jgi:hypothetical protein
MRARLLLLLAPALAACDLIGDGVEIVRYTGPTITEADATVTDPMLGTPRGWSGLRVGDEVVLYRETLCGDECNQRIELRFEGRGALPSDAEATFTQSEYLPERFEERGLEIARIEVQDWGPEVFSGVVHLEPVDEVLQVPIVFWADDLPFAAY